jgi:hypothetical protein
MRDRYVEMIALTRKIDAHPSALVDKAHRLLTRHWGRSDWGTRANILKTVDWLLNVAMIHPGVANNDAVASSASATPTPPVACRARRS